MFKTLVTLFRGRAAEAEERLADAHALTILDQQLRDAATGLDRTRRALALAIAGDQREATRLTETKARIADLEVRVTAALHAGAEADAREGAEAIARLEAEREAAERARALFSGEIARMKVEVADAEARISAVERGRRVARAAEAVRQLRQGGVEAAPINRETLGAAEATLARLIERQADARAADEALIQLTSATGPEAVAKRLAERGFGPRATANADDILKRLAAKAATPTA